MKAWIARDMDESLWLYSTKPHKEAEMWAGKTSCTAKLNKYKFLEVDWKDDEPTEVEITIKSKKK